jgi:hypothetical protein
LRRGVAQGGVARVFARGGLAALSLLVRFGHKVRLDGFLHDELEVITYCNHGMLPERGHQ